jgi:hypothetical protein
MIDRKFQGAYHIKPKDICALVTAERAGAGQEDRGQGRLRGKDG